MLVMATHISQVTASFPGKKTAPPNVPMGLHFGKMKFQYPRPRPSNFS